MAAASVYNNLRRWVVFVAAMALFSAASAAAAPYRICVLMLGSVRADPVAGLKAGLAELGRTEGDGIVYDIRDAGEDQSKLAPLAADIITGRPAVAIAAGGVEADALKNASAGTTVPVVFLSVASAVDRGLVVSMQRSGNNLTGVDTNDTELTAKRLWFIRKMLPAAKTVLIPSVPTLTPAVRTVAVAQAEAPELGLGITTLEGNSKEDITNKCDAVDWSSVDVIYIGMAAPVWQIEKSVFLPISVAHKIPIMGVSQGDLNRGAMVVYACSRFDTGKQASRLVDKVLKGTPPADIPVETPLRLEFVINRWMVDRLGLTLPGKVWRLADRVVDIPLE